jgi:Predicted phosphohydrolases
MIFIIIPIMLAILTLLLFYNGKNILVLLNSFIKINSSIFWIVFVLIQLLFIACQFIPYRIAALLSGYFMGFTFYYFLINLIFEIVKLFGIKIVGIEIIKISMTLLIMIIGTYSANKIVIKNYDISVNKEIDSLNIVMFSDVHLGYLIQDKYVDKIVAKVNSLNPDIVIIPGDFFDGAFSKTRNIDTVKDNLRKIKSKYGVYASLGNHDLVKDKEQVREFFKECNIILLDDDKITVENITIIGRLDATPIDNFKQERKETIELMEGIDRNNFIILLDHKPTEIDQAVAANVDLIVSGHTHKGQLFPGELVTNMLFKVDYGYKKYNDTNVIVTSGVGYWGIPMRVLTNSEIVNIKVTSNRSDKKYVESIND